MDAITCTMVVGRVEMTKTDACGQEILCLPRETDSIIGVKFGQTRNSSSQEIREFTTEDAEDAETVGGRANPDSQEKQNSLALCSLCFLCSEYLLSGGEAV